MKLRITEQREIEIDISACRKRVSQEGLYDDKEREALLEVFDLFEKGKFKEAIKAVKDMPDEWEGYLDESVYDTLVEFQDGAKIEIVK